MTMTENKDKTLDLATVNRSAMARALKVDLAHISRILSGKRTPSLELAMRMAQYLGVSLDELCRLLEQVKE